MEKVDAVGHIHGTVIIDVGSILALAARPTAEERVQEVHGIGNIDSAVPIGVSPAERHVATTANWRDGEAVAAWGWNRNQIVQTDDRIDKSRAREIHVEHADATVNCISIYIIDPVQRQFVSTFKSNRAGE